jgi:hypothetical protein
MKKSIIVIASIFLLGCTDSALEMKPEPTNIQEVIQEDYVLHKTQNE